MLFSQLKTDTRINLNDSGVLNFSVQDLDDSMQDAYDDIVSLTQCIIKKTTLNWTGQLSYYDFGSLIAEGDYLAVIAIRNNVNNEWLDDNKNMRDFDMMGVDWELRSGTPLWWAVLNFKYTAIYPRYINSSGNFDLYYWATAPLIINSENPLIAPDFQDLLTKYSTMDLLESFEEFSKASIFWNDYNTHIEKYRERVKNLAKTDLLIRI
jgi:hypothetical protein